MLRERKGVKIKMLNFYIRVEMNGIFRKKNIKIELLVSLVLWSIMKFLFHITLPLPPRKLSVDLIQTIALWQPWQNSPNSCLRHLNHTLATFRFS
jgi:hypothetical protein